MFKKSRLPLLVILILLLNVLIYFRATLTLEGFECVFGECARNSGRTSAAINLVILFMIGYYGLKSIYKEENKRDAFRVLITLFAINHLIHFFFVYNYFSNHITDLGISHNPHGFITFVCLAILPLILWASKSLNKVLYLGIILHLFNITYFMADTFYSRVKPVDSAYLHQIGILIMGGALLYVLYRMYKENSISFVEDNQSY
jgi:succinate dehydrogenase hydrophobic anchor subunit